MPDDVMSVQQAQNPSNDFKCRKRIENDSFHIRKFCWQRGSQILPYANVCGLGCSIRTVSCYLAREKNCPEKTIVRKDEVLSLECLLFHSISSLFLLLPYLFFEQFACGPL